MDPSEDLNVPVEDAFDITRVEVGCSSSGPTTWWRAPTPLPPLTTDADAGMLPFELRLGRLVDFEKPDFVGRQALLEEQAAGGAPRRMVGLTID